ncbi:MAG: cupredoxin domain-containing protein [Candidatus Aenigmarchaeota archaeon]|nr:cupredoxin domain-containing protein [Candidatus Aenigmarchaeota archaeon]
MEEAIKINKKLLLKILAVCGILSVPVIFLQFPSPYTPVFVFTTMLLAWGAYYAVSSKESMSEMCCMMSGMTYGMTSGFFIGAMAGLATTDFMIAMIAGAVSGILFGIPVGRAGGPLSAMEGVMAGPMGGIMGGMTGVMVQFFNVGLFMPFLVIIVTFTVWEMTKVIKSSAKISRGFLYAGAVISVLAISSAFVNAYPSGASFALASSGEKTETSAILSGDIQEVTIRMGLLQYTPNYIVVKKDIPLRIRLEADKNAGCTRSIVFPDFNIRKTVPAGGADIVEFTPTRAGTYRFACTMSMASGSIVVQ